MGIPDRKHILQLIANNPTEREYFFQKLAKEKNPAEWLFDLKNGGYFEPYKNPEPKESQDQIGLFFIPQWEILGFLLNLAEDNQTKDDGNTTTELVHFIDSVIKYNNSTKRIDNYRTDWMLIQIIFALPFNFIKKEHVEYIWVALNSKWSNNLLVDAINDEVLPVLLMNYPYSHNFLIMLMDYVWQFKESKKDFLKEEYISILTPYKLKRLMEKNRKLIAEKIKEFGVELSENIIRGIINKDDSRFNLFRIPHITNDSQNEFPDRYEIQLIYFLRECLLYTSIEQLKQKIIIYIRDQHPIFRRLAICCIDKRYGELCDVFWAINDNPLEYHFIKHELYPFFQHHAKEFDTKEIERITGWIESKNYFISIPNELNEMDKENHLYYKKKEWLFALLDSNNALIKELFNHYESLNKDPLVRPGLDYCIGKVQYGKKGNDFTSSICSKSNEDIAAYFMANTNYYYDDESESLHECIQKYPDKFMNNMTPFDKLNLNYQYEIFNAFLQIWRNGSKLSWEVIFDYIARIIDAIDSKLEYDGNELEYRDGVIRTIANLIEEGTRVDNHSFEPALLPNAKNILLRLEAMDIPNKYYAIDKMVSILNSIRKNIYSALINYSLRYARLYKHEEGNQFDPDIFILFNKRLLENNNEEYFYSLGHYIPNILFLDKAWVNNNINAIFSKYDDSIWLLAMRGYLLSSSIYEDIYIMLKQNDHLLKAIHTDFNDKDINSNIIQQICVAYLNNSETLADNTSLMKEVISNGNCEQLKEVINYIWTRSEHIIEKSLHKNIDILLAAIYSRLKKMDDYKAQNILMSAMTSWIVFINKFDSNNYKIFMDLATHSSDDYNSSDMVEGLSKIVNNSPKEVADIMINIIKHDEKYPFYDEEVVIKILDTLKQYNYESKITQICNRLIQKGRFSYKDILEQYCEKK
jgi:hypothetical protein